MTQEQKSQTHHVERDPARALGSMGEKAAAVALKAAAYSEPYGIRTAPCGKEKEGKGSCHTP